MDQDPQLPLQASLGASWTGAEAEMVLRWCAASWEGTKVTSGPVGCHQAWKPTSLAKLLHKL